MRNTHHSATFRLPFLWQLLILLSLEQHRLSQAHKQGDLGSNPCPSTYSLGDLGQVSCPQTQCAHLGTKWGNTVIATSWTIVGIYWEKAVILSGL